MKRIQSVIIGLRRAIACYAIVLPSMALLMTFVYLPVVWAFFKSFYEFEVGGSAHFVGLRNYREYLTQDPTTAASLLNMTLITAFLVAVKLSVPLVVAKLIHSLPNERMRYCYRIGFLLPVVVPTIAVQLLWCQMIYSDHGLLNTTLGFVGLNAWTHGWLSDPRTALVAVMFFGFPFVGGFDVLIYYAGLAAIPESVIEAAAIEGCTGARAFFCIDVPLVFQQLKLMLLLTIIGGFQGFETLFVLTRGGPGFKTMVPALWMYLNAFNFERMGYACAIGVLLFGAIVGLTVTTLRYFKSSNNLSQTTI